MGAYPEGRALSANTPFTVWIRAWATFLDIAQAGVVRPATEADVQSALYGYGIEAWQRLGLPLPVAIWTGKSVYSPRVKIDLAFGQPGTRDAVAVELKYEPPEDTQISKGQHPVVFAEEVLKDIARLDDHLNAGFDHAWAIFISACGRCQWPSIKRDWPDWQKLSLGPTPAEMLVVKKTRPHDV